MSEQGSAKNQNCSSMGQCGPPAGKPSHLVLGGGRASLTSMPTVKLETKDTGGGEKWWGTLVTQHNEEVSGWEVRGLLCTL